MFLILNSMKKYIVLILLITSLISCNSTMNENNLTVQSELKKDVIEVDNKVIKIIDNKSLIVDGEIKESNNLIFLLKKETKIIFKFKNIKMNWQNNLLTENIYELNWRNREYF